VAINAHPGKPVGTLAYIGRRRRTSIEAAPSAPSIREDKTANFRWCAASGRTHTCGRSRQQMQQFTPSDRARDRCRACGTFVEAHVAGGSRKDPQSHRRSHGGVPALPRRGCRWQSIISVTLPAVYELKRARSVSSILMAV